MGQRRPGSILVATILLTISSVAMAEPAGQPSFLPIEEVGGPTADSVVVEPGDHLWKISQSRLEQVLSRAAEPDEVEPLWRSVIDANRQRLRSGDPDLIYPGETILIPVPG
jgi:nucleoid-associated protein YgaU